MDNKSLKQQSELMKKPVPDTPEERSAMDDLILDNFCGSCSSSDCTGLIPADPDSKKRRRRIPRCLSVRRTECRWRALSRKKTFGKKGTHGGV